MPLQKIPLLRRITEYKSSGNRGIKKGSTSFYILLLQEVGVNSNGVLLKIVGCFRFGGGLILKFFLAFDSYQYIRSDDAINSDSTQNED